MYVCECLDKINTPSHLKQSNYLTFTILINKLELRLDFLDKKVLVMKF